MRHFKFLSSALLSVLLLSSCGGGESQQTQEAQKFDLLTVKKSDYTLNSSYPASIRGRQDIKIIPQVDGYLREIYVKEGDAVKQGQLLFVIDQVAYRAAVKSARANVEQMRASLAKAQQEYDSQKKLFDKKIVSDYDLTQAQNDLNMAKANLQAAQATLESANNDLSFTELRSPSDGVIGTLPYRKGDYVGPSTQDGLTVVADNKQMYVYFSLTESKVMEYLATYKTMAEAIQHMPAAQLQLAGGKMYDQTGKIESVSGVVDEGTGAVSVRAVFQNPGGQLLSGGTGQIILPNDLKDVIVIPQEATYEIQDKVFVFKVVDGKTVSSMVQVENQNDGKNYVVTGGLKPGDVIIAKGAGLVHEGTPVLTDSSKK